MFETGLIPPNVNFNTPNPAIHWDKFGLVVPVTATPLPCRSSSGRSLVAMPSTGIGGANGHCVVESPGIITPTLSRFWDSTLAASFLFVAGGLSPNSVASVAESLKSKLVTNANPGLISAIYGRRSRSMIWRSHGVLSPGSSLKFSEPVLTPRSPGPLVFVFSGQGPQYFDSQLLFSSHKDNLNLF